jgi:uncharacterized protein (TIGR02646 family)
MRRVDRSKIPRPKVLDPSNPQISEEISQAKDYYLTLHKLRKTGSRSVGKKKEIFKLFRHETVKRALEDLFHKKCAYCEGRYVAFVSGDIEHWRPKAEVITDEASKKKRYGYYWLAADWDNLMPSCNDCNRERYHYDSIKKKIVMLGKGNWFPLEKGCKHATDEKGLTKEKPLLLNPYEDNPDDYLEFHGEGIVKAKLDKSNKPKAKAIASVRFYALNRRELVYERLELIKLIQLEVQEIEDLAKAIKKLPDTESEALNILKDSLTRKYKKLLGFTDEKKPFSAMANQIIHTLLTEAQKRIEKE